MSRPAGVAPGTARRDGGPAASPAGVEGLVVGAHRRHFRVRLASGEERSCLIRGRSLQVACGDNVLIQPTAPGEGVIESVGERASAFFRADAFRTKVIATNVSRAIGVVAGEPALSSELLDRWIVAAESNGCDFAILHNKIDLPAAAATEQALAPYRELGYRVVGLSARHDARPAQALVDGERSVLVGQSGVGKSTLINALVPGARARVGELSQALAGGRHTTTATVLYVLEAGGWLVDSPGMHEFGLAHLDRARIEAGFREIRAVARQCRFRDCTHRHEPGCAVADAVARGEVRERRLQSLHRLLDECAAKPAW